MTPEERLRRKNEFDGNLTIGVRQFNLTTGRATYQERRASEKAQFVNSGTGLLQEELGVARPCPACSVDEGRLVFVKDGFCYHKCGTCGMLYTNPVLKEERLHSAYLEEDIWTQILCNETQQSLDRKKFQYGLDLIEEYQPQKGRLCNIMKLGKPELL